MSKNFTTKVLARQAIVAALYAVLTYALPGLAYGPIQFRASEILTLLAFFNGEYVLGLTVGCLIANLLSPFGFIDVVVGTLASFIAVYAMSKIKNIWVASLMPAIANILVGLEIYLISKEPINFFVITGQIMLSEFIIVTVIGVVVFKALTKNEGLVNILELGRNNRIKG